MATLNGYRLIDDDVLYSPVFDLLIDMGQAQLQRIQDQERCKRLLEVWRESRQDPTWQESLSSGWQLFCQDLETAKGVLGGEVSLDLDGDAAEQVKDALTILDRLVFVAVAIEPEPLGELPADFVQEVKAFTERLTTDEAPSAVRLIPLNPYRQAVLEHLAHQDHYLFPWYTEWVSVPAETLDDLVALWAGERAEAESALDKLAPEDFALLLSAIKNDEPLCMALRERAKFQKTLRLGLQMNPAWRLLALAKYKASQYALPSIISRMGLDRLATMTRQETVADDEQLNVLDQTLRWAFCGPQSLVSTQERLRDFQTVLSGLSGVQSDRLHRGSALYNLRQWLDGSLADHEFAAKIFGSWLAGLKRAARRVRLREIITQMESFWVRLGRALSPQIEFRQPAFCELGVEGPGVMMFLVRGQQEIQGIQIQNPVLAPLPTSVEGYRLPSLMESPLDENYGRLLDILGTLDRFFWAAWVYRQGETEPARLPAGNVGSARRFPFLELPPADYALVILALATEREPLQEFIRRVEAGEAAPGQPVEGVAVIFFTPETQQESHEQV